MKDNLIIAQLIEKVSEIDSIKFKNPNIDYQSMYILVLK